MPLESLAPDERAVVELILKQKKSYSDLAELLSIAPDAVRRRAHAGLHALAPPPAALDEQQRGRVADFLLGQLEGGERAGADKLLATAPARTWAAAVAEQLRPLSANGLSQLPAEEEPLSAGQPADEKPRPVERPAEKEALPAERPADEEPRPAAVAASGAPPATASRRGGVVLLAVCAALVASLAAWLITRDDGNGNGSGSPRTSSGDATPTATPTPTSLAEIPLRAVNGSKAKGLMQVNATQDGQVGIVVVAGDVKPSGEREAYAVWLTDARRKAYRIGFEGKDVGARGAADGTLALSGPSRDVDRARFTRALTQYDRLVVSLETSDKATEPASVVLQGSLKRLQGGD